MFIKQNQRATSVRIEKARTDAISVTTEVIFCNKCEVNPNMPTTGDRVRLVDTNQIIEVERGLTTNGEEVKFGGGKVIEDIRAVETIGSLATQSHAPHAKHCQILPRGKNGV